MTTMERAKEVEGEFKSLAEKMFNQWEGSFKSIVEKVVSEGRITRTEGRKLIKEYTVQFNRERGRLEDKFDKEVNKLLKKLVQPTRKRLEEVANKLASLEKEIDKLEN
ncbi:MAG: hypothetical protein Kow0090_09590 [Myxococcota bacterium]